jgi:VWFA-related protein
MLRLWCAILLAVVVGLAHPAEDTLRVDVDLVNIFFTISSHRGRLITDIDRESLSVLEDGQPQSITHFSREIDVPLTIVVLMDTSGSVWDKLRFEKKAAAEFFFTAVRPGRDQAALVTFDHDIEVQQDYTDNQAALASRAGRVIAGGGTRLYDALHFVIEHKLNGPQERKLVVLITDGDDQKSRRSPEEVIDLAQRNNVAIYAISMNALGVKPKESDRSDQILEMLAAETGGKGFFPRKLEKLASSFCDIANELRSQYSLGYRSTNARRDGTFRTVHIQTKQSRYSVRARSGYYAPSEALAKKN